MHRLMVIGLVVGLLVGTGCRTAPIEYAQAEPDKPGTTFLILGLWNFFSKGLVDITDDLNEDGHYARTLSGYAWQDIGDHIIEAESKGELRRPLILGGHSLGADKSLKLARKLEKAGIAVDYVVLLDATNPPDVPSNVKRCHNIYLSHPATDWFPAFRGIPVQAVNPETELINFNVRLVETGPLSEIDFNHFDIESDPDIQAFMVELIRARLNGKHDTEAIFPAQVNKASN
ncbi:MAG: hypothetical protein AB8C95_07820 [Phycisphaeraceae bacterium]